jgi:serine/threonine protein kinase
MSKRHTAGKDLFYGVMHHYHSSQRPSGFAEEDACHLTAQILNALRHLHLRRIVHCDLKPENILCHEQNGTLKLKLADWGFAQVLYPSTLKPKPS